MGLRVAVVLFLAAGGAAHGVSDTCQDEACVAPRALPPPLLSDLRRPKAAAFLQTQSAMGKSSEATTTTSSASPPEPPRALDPGTVELVVASYCEENTWFKRYPGPITIYSKKEGCAGTLRQAVDQSASTRGRVVELPNVGREGHSYVWHIVNNWCNLSTYTAFAQGRGEHNGVRVIDFMLSFLANGAPGAGGHGEEPPPPPLVPGKEMAVVPILHRNQKGYIFYRDKEEEESTGGMDNEKNVQVFEVPPDYVERQRLLYTLMYGGSVCDVPPMVFPAGAQFIVHKNAIYAKPLSFWKQLLVEFDRWENFGYHAEREWLYIFDPTKKLTEWGQDCFRLPQLFWEPKYHTWNCSTAYRKYQGPEDLVHNSAGVPAPPEAEHAPEPGECSGGTLRTFSYSKEPQRACGLCSHVKTYRDIYRGGADAMVLQALREVEEATGGSLDCPSGGVRRLSANASSADLVEG